jgi:hypothetical protein
MRKLGNLRKGSFVQPPLPSSHAFGQSLFIRYEEELQRVVCNVYAAWRHTQRLFRSDNEAAMRKLLQSSSAGASLGGPVLIRRGKITTCAKALSFSLWIQSSSAGASLKPVVYCGARSTLDLYPAWEPRQRSGIPLQAVWSGASTCCLQCVYRMATYLKALLFGQRGCNTKVTPVLVCRGKPRRTSPHPQLTSGHRLNLV